jgi:hypothetical protein
MPTTMGCTHAWLAAQSKPKYYFEMKASLMSITNCDHPYNLNQHVSHHLGETLPPKTFSICFTSSKAKLRAAASSCQRRLMKLQKIAHMQPK